MKTVVKKISHYIILLSLFVAAPGFAQDRAVDDIDGATLFIQDLGNRTIDILNNTSLTESERYTSFRSLFATATDIKTLTRMLLGRHIKNVIKQGYFDEYQRSVEDYIVTEFEEQIQLIGFESVAVTGTRPAPGSRGELVVRTVVKVKKGDDFEADWRVQKKGGDFSILNVEVLGYNFAVSGRQLFQSRIKELGLKGHLAELKEEYGQKRFAS